MHAEPTGDRLSATSDWSDAVSSAESDGEFSRQPSPKRLAAEIVKGIPWSNGRARINPFCSASGCSLSGVIEADADGTAVRSRSETPLLGDQAVDLSGIDCLEQGNRSASSVGGIVSCVAGLLQPESLVVLSDNITSRRGSRGCHLN